MNNFCPYCGAREATCAIDSGKTHVWVGSKKNNETGAECRHNQRLRWKIDADYEVTIFRSHKKEGEK